MTPILIAYALNLLDYLLTAYWVSFYGTEVEANPLMRWAFENNVAWAVKIFGVGGLMALVGCCIKYKPKVAWSGVFLAVVYGLTTLYHIAIIISTKILT